MILCSEGAHHMDRCFFQARRIAARNGFQLRRNHLTVGDLMEFSYSCEQDLHKLFGSDVVENSVESIIRWGFRRHN